MREGHPQRLLGQIQYVKHVPKNVFLNQALRRLHIFDNTQVSSKRLRNLSIIHDKNN